MLQRVCQRCLIVGCELPWVWRSGSDVYGESVTHPADSWRAELRGRLLVAATTEMPFGSRPCAQR
jgi:hypothetical protein